MADYTQEQREQAARVLEERLEVIEDNTAYNQYSKKQYEEYYREEAALRTAIACLRSPGASPDVDGKAGGWLDTADIKPDSAHETIIVQDENGNVYTAPGWIVRDFPATHPRWMHLPKVPGSEARKQPEEVESMSSYTNGNDFIDKTATYTIQPQPVNVTIDITGGCEYCKAGKYIMEHHGFVFDAWSQITDGRLDIMYSSKGGGDEYALNAVGHKGVKINYCPMCGRKLEAEG